MTYKYEKIKRILNMSRKPDGLPVKEIARRAHMKENKTRAYLSRLMRRGLIERPGRGMYRSL